MSVGPAEILIILVVALMVFGPQRLPEVARQVGSAMRELRRMQDTVRGELDMVLHPEHGTSSSPLPALEPDDHSPVDVAVVVTPDTTDVTPEVEATDDPRAGDRNFSGPSDSFI
jgi:sec-independent protein translocase protein TatA